MPLKENLNWARSKVVRSILGLFDLLLIIPFLLVSFLSRLLPRKIDVGLGPEPLINNVYHKKALVKRGYSAETFVSNVYFITDEFDYSLVRWRSIILARTFIPYWLFLRCLFKYRFLFIYFNGGPLWTTPILRRLEPFFYKLAGIRIIVMPYGGDVQVLTRSRNLHFKHSMSIDYPQFRKLRESVRDGVDRWTRHAEWVISGCEWVDYMYHWDTLMLGHFSIDVDRWDPHECRSNKVVKEATFKILHAPNHTAVKGTQALLNAVKELKEENLNIDLNILRGLPNSEIRKAMISADLVADQFVIGWYAMFSIEAMAMEKPVLCFLREDLIDLYLKAGLVAIDEIPLINTSILEVKDRIRWCYFHRAELAEIGKKGRDFVLRHHSTEAVGGVFADILKRLGLHSHGL